MDAAKLSRKYEAMVRTTAGGLHDEKRVVNALLEAADQLDRASLATLLSAENLRLRIKAKGRDKDKKKGPGDPTKSPRLQAHGGNPA